MRDVMRNT